MRLENSIRSRSSGAQRTIVAHEVARFPAASNPPLCGWCHCCRSHLKAPRSCRTQRLILLSLLIPAAASAQPAWPPASVDPLATGRFSTSANTLDTGPSTPPPDEPSALPAGKSITTSTFHHGLTFEADLGVGLIHRSSTGTLIAATEVSFGGLDIGVGGWISEDLALSFRISSETSTHYASAFLGPSLQFWFDHHLWASVGVGLGVAGGDGIDDNDLWFGGGLGLAVFGAFCAISGGCGADTRAVEGGGSADVRVGYTFTSRVAHAVDISVEMNVSDDSYAAGFNNGSRSSITLTSFALLLGYQYL